MAELNLRIPDADDIVVNLVSPGGETLQAPFPELVEAWQNKDNTGGSDTTELEERIQQLEAQVSGLEEQLTDAVAAKDAAVAENTQLAADLATAKAERDAANAAYQELVAALLALLPGGK